MHAPSMTEQTDHWTDWVARSRSWEVNPDNRRRARYVLEAIGPLARPGSKLLEVGCGSGWMALELAKLCSVTATDLASPVMEELKRTQPQIEWVGGDFLAVELPSGPFDLVVCMETLSHVPDQEAFVARLAALTVPGGTLVLTTQNGAIWSRDRRLEPPRPGQLRRWQTRERLHELFAPHFELQPIRTCAPGGNRGLLRLINNRYTARAAAAVIGEESWNLARERLGLGLSLVLVGVRRGGGRSGVGARP